MSRLSAPNPYLKNNTVRPLLTNIFLFFLFMAAMSFFLYCVGNYQHLSEQSLFLLLRIVFWSGIILGILALFSVVFAAGMFFLKQITEELSAIPCYILFAAAGLLFSFFAGGIIAFSEGRG